MTWPSPSVPVPPEPSTEREPAAGAEWSTEREPAAGAEWSTGADPDAGVDPVEPAGWPAAPGAGRASDPRVTAAFDLALRVAAGLIAAGAAALSAVLELFLATVRVGGHLIGVSVLLAVAANVALSWFAHRAVGTGWAVGIPALVWFGLMVVAAGGTAEGDILLAGNNWVGLAMIVAGSMSFAVMGFRLVLGPRR